MKNILTGLEEQFWKELEESEGITKEDIEFVDLEIGFSPVLQFKNSKYPAEVTETIGGNYIVHGEMLQTVDPTTLKIMRYRYLSNRKNPINF